ncbi:MAG: hypothetical protein V8T36_05170 [Ruthenibacterium lactatiformans]
MNDVFTHDVLETLGTGNMASAMPLRHHGGAGAAPMRSPCDPPHQGNMALAHNGNLTNAGSCARSWSCRAPSSTPRRIPRSSPTSSPASA